MIKAERKHIIGKMNTISFDMISWANKRQHIEVSAEDTTDDDSKPEAIIAIKSNGEWIFRERLSLTDPQRVDEIILERAYAGKREENLVYYEAYENVEALLLPILGMKCSIPFTGGTHTKVSYEEAMQALEAGKNIICDMGSYVYAYGPDTSPYADNREHPLHSKPGKVIGGHTLTVENILNGDWYIVSKRRK